MLAHYVAGEPDWKAELERSMYTEAGWGLGRNPGNIVEMTGLGERRIHASRNHAWQDGPAGLSLRNKTLDNGQGFRLIHSSPTNFCR